MEAEEIEWVDLVGTDGKTHKVDLTKMDRHFNGDGTLTTDEQWDEDKRRAVAGLAGELVVPIEVTTELPPGSVFASYPEEEGNDG